MVGSGRLAGKIGVITGAARGIGEGIARAMAAEGATLYLADRNLTGVEAVASAIGARPFALDVTDESAWQALAEQIEKDQDRLDILVNNAGIEMVRPLHQMSAHETRSILSVNLEGPMAGCRSLLALLAAGGRRGTPASVVNISSMAALVGQADLSAYSVSKAAIAHLSRCLTVEWAGQGHAIRLNTIFPGCIRTPMLEETIDGWVESGALDADSAWSTLQNLSPMKQIGTVEDIAMGAVYLASDEAKFVNGIDLIIDGGWSAT